MRKTIFHSESVFYFFLRGLCSSHGLCFLVGFASLLELGYYSWLGRCSLLLLNQTNTWTSFFTQNLFYSLGLNSLLWLRFVTRAIFHAQLDYSSFELFFHFDSILFYSILFYSIHVYTALFIQVLLFI